MAEEKIQILPRTRARLLLLSALAHDELQTTSLTLRELGTDGDASHDNILSDLQTQFARGTVREREIGNILRLAMVIDVNKAARADMVMLGSRLRLRMSVSSKKDHVVDTVFWIGSSIDVQFSPSDEPELVLSNISPIAKAILGKRKGFRGTVEQPEGAKTRLQILELLDPGQVEASNN